MTDMFNGDPDFMLGLAPADIDDIVGERYSGWTLTRGEIGINMRRDTTVPESSNGTFLNRMLLADRNSQRLFNRNYSFSLTSPLSGGEVYAIQFDITSRNFGSAIVSLSDWTSRQTSRLGTDVGIFAQNGEFTLEYFYDGDGRPLPHSAFSECHRATAGAHSLYSHPPEEVKTMIKAIKRTRCVYRINITADLDAHGQVYQSRLFIMDYRRLTDDNLKRVQYGMTPPRRQLRGGR